MEKLETLYKAIPKKENYSFKKLKDYLIEMKNEKNNDIKKVKRNYIIENTLYFVYQFIKKNTLYIVSTNTYDIDDVINSCCEIWIELIDSDFIINSEKICLVENKMLQELTNKLAINKENVNDFINSQFKVGITEIDSLLYNFLREKKIKSSYNYKDFLQFLEKELNHYYKNDNNNYYNLKKHKQYDNFRFNGIYTILYNIYNSLDYDNIDLSKINKTKIKILKYLFINKGINNLNVDINNVTVNYLLNDYIFNKEFLELILNKLNDDEKEVIKRHFGLNNNSRESFDEIALDFKLSKSRINQIEAHALRKLKNSKKLKEIYKEGMIK